MPDLPCRSTPLATSKGTVSCLAIVAKHLDGVRGRCYPSTLQGREIEVHLTSDSPVGIIAETVRLFS